MNTVLQFFLLLIGFMVLARAWPGKAWPKWVGLACIVLLATNNRYLGIVVPFVPWAVWVAGLFVRGLRGPVMFAQLDDAAQEEELRTMRREVKHE